MSIDGEDDGGGLVNMIRTMTNLLCPYFYYFLELVPRGVLVVTKA
jgi:hypothetical protein